MSDHKQKQPNGDDLIQFKELIGDAGSSDVSLDDILAEFGSRPRKPDNLVAFPSPAPDSDQGPEEEGEAQEERAEEEEGPPPPPAEKKSPVSSFLSDIERRADDYADRMFEEDEQTDLEEVRRLEKLIPGTDREQSPKQSARPPRPRRQEPPPPDLSPRELAQNFGRRLGWLRARVLLVFLLFCLALFQLLIPFLGYIWLPPLDDPLVQSWGAVGLLAAGVLLGYDVLFAGLARVFRLRLGMDTLAVLACLFTLADGICLARSPAPPRLPYSAVVLAQLFFLLHGDYHKRCGLRLACRTAAASSSPYRVTLDEKKWNAKDTYCKWSGTPQSFGSQLQTDDGAQRIYRRVCPVLLLGSLLLTLLSCDGDWNAGRVFWTLSALFTASAAFGSSLVYGRSLHKASRRLARNGAALAGWPGISGSRRDGRVLVTDADLFPPGYVELRSNYRIMPEFPRERVLAYTATLIRDSGSGIAKPFLDELRRAGGLSRHAEALDFHEGGGLSARIRGDRVLVGSASFMKLMEIPVSQGLNVRGAVFCAINGRLAGIFALNYTLPDTVFPALEELLQEKVSPVLATRDFNLIPAMLHQRFKLAADRMDFPPVARRRELSDPEQPHSQTLTALLCREGLLPFAEAITAARRLYRATLVGSVLCCTGSVLGLVLCAYLTSVSAYTSLSPLSLLVYQLTWLAPVWLLSSWVPRY